VQLTRRADKSAVLVVPNVKVRMEARRFISSVSLHDLLQDGLTFVIVKPDGIARDRNCFPLQEGL
jgi:hypothetical protein